MYRCPVCGSTEVIWDEFRGEVVCSSCGLVIDQIYYTYRNSNDRIAEDKPREKKDYKKINDKPGRILRMYNKLFGSWNLRRGLDINISSLEALNSGVYTGRVFRHNRDVLLEKMFDISPSLKKIYDYTSLFPKLSSRTFRTRLLISYMLLKVSGNGFASNEVLSRAFSISKNHLNRVKKELRNYPELSKFIGSLNIDAKEIEELDRYITKIANTSKVL
ncbi:MAG: TFIIB-type zinc ribbon-containing protein [Sulfolobales archaeon]